MVFDLVFYFSLSFFSFFFFLFVDYSTDKLHVHVIFSYNDSCLFSMIAIDMLVDVIYKAYTPFSPTALYDVSNVKDIGHACLLS